MSYATWAELKAYLKIPTATTTEDTLLQTFLDEADKIIDEIVGLPSAAATATTRTFYDPPIDGLTLLFDRAQVCVGITAVVNGDGTTLANTDYAAVPAGELPTYGLRLTPASTATWDTTAGIAVTALWANTTNANGTVDALIRGAALQLATWLYRSKDNVADLSRPMRTDDGFTVLPLALPKTVLERLQFRRGLV
jgi:hypothetical protein